MVVGEKVRNLVGKERGYGGGSLKFDWSGDVVKFVWAMKFKIGRGGCEMNFIGVMKFKNWLE